MASTNNNLKNMDATKQPPQKSAEDLQRERQQQEHIEEQRKSMLSQVLLPEAMQRLQRISIVNPQNARAVENYLLQSARSGRIRSKIGESELIGLLEQVSTQTKGPSVKIKRKAYDSDDDLGLTESSGSSDGW
eukprot:TRINITY_DN2690_c0_g1_i2.p1 TRINITY_DN2690_c0_g1~~TRINITY_DN2690_c0_g1_i2.p1  ORF type:complete len:133 (+),score=27.50 TRINITY_DN2690_c0_g1_i2:86-484(+)